MVHLTPHSENKVLKWKTNKVTFWVMIGSSLTVLLTIFRVVRSFLRKVNVTVVHTTNLIYTS